MADPAKGPGRGHALLYVAFFLSGISGLIYESIWSRYIKQLLGSAAVAQVLVMSLFMGGMSLGALWAGRRVAQVRNPIRAYALVEAIIGLYALAFPTIFAAASRFCYDVVFPALGGGAGVEVAKWSVAATLILPPCVLLGTTFPLMSVGILRSVRARTGEVLSLLYFTNSLGAALGAVLAGFGLVPRVGLAGALVFAGALNGLIFVGTWRAGAGAKSPPIAESSDRGARDITLLFLAVAFGTGLSSFMYEIGWIRLLSMVLGSATHSFEVMLSAFVFGLACGGLWVRRRMDRFKRPELVLAVVQLLMGLAAVATLPTYRIAVEAMSWLLDEELRSRTEALWLGYNVLRYLLCLLIMLPATFCAGMTLPLLTHVLLKRGAPEAVVGKIYGVNTLGAIIGAIAAGLLLMPLAGLKMVIVLGAAVDVALGIWLLRTLVVAEPKFAGTLRNAQIGGVASLAIGALLFRVDPMVLSATVFRHGRTRLPSSYELLRYVDGRTASVTMIDNREIPGYRIIYTNGKPDASVVLERWPEGRAKNQGPRIAGDEPNQFLVGLLPFAIRPNATHAALIGFGSGVSCHTMLGSPNLKRLDTIEIEREMVESARAFLPENERAYEDPRNHIHFNDAKAYFASAGTQYDIIVSEPTNPWVSGVSSLFTVEFYREAKRYLRDDGILAQWIQGYELSDELLLTVLAALDQEFPDYLVMRVGSRDWVILATKNGTVGAPDAQVLDWPGMARPLELLGIHDAGQLDTLIAANKRMLHPYLVGRTPNTDAHPVLDTGAEHARFMRASAELMLALRWVPAPARRVLGGIETRPYPSAGIGDLRRPHVLEEAERARLWMRAFADRDAPVPEDLSSTPMTLWHEATRALDGAGGDWGAWLRTTWQIFSESVPHVELDGEPWWQRVRAIAGRDEAPLSVRRSVSMMDAVSRWDPRAVLSVAEGRHVMPLPAGFVDVAVAVALVDVDASASERCAHAKRMNAAAEPGLEEDASARAYNMVRAALCPALQAKRSQ